MSSDISGVASAIGSIASLQFPRLLRGVKVQGPHRLVKTITFPEL